MGKTTLLTHIAARKLAIPPNIDVLLCEQGNEIATERNISMHACILMDIHVIE